MKILLVISAVCIASTMGKLNFAQMNKLLHGTAFDICRTTWPVSNVDITDLLRGVFTYTPQVMKCLLKCFFQRKSVLSETGQISDLRNLLRDAGLTDVGIANRVNAACLSPPPSPDCQHAMNLMICIHDNA